MSLADVNGWLRGLVGQSRPAAPPAAATLEHVAAAPPANATAAADVHSTHFAHPPVQPPHRWSAERLYVAEDLWGEGFVTPVGHDEVMRLAVPLGLSKAVSVIVLGAGAGGAARCVGSLGAWVSGFEADADLVAYAPKVLARGGPEMVKHVTVEAFDGNRPVFRGHGFHHAIALDPFRVLTPEKVLAALAAAVKPGGQLVVLQSVADLPLPAADPAVATWARLDGHSGDLPTEAAISAALTSLGFSIRVTEDVSDRHTRLTLAGWKRLVAGLTDVPDGEAKRPPMARAAAIVKDAEMWMCRLRLMQAGRMRLVRWSASAPAASH